MTQRFCFLLPMPGAFFHSSAFNMKQEKCAPENSNELLPVITSPWHIFLRLDGSSENKLLFSLFSTVLVKYSAILILYRAESCSYLLFTPMPFHSTHLRKDHSNSLIQSIAMHTFCLNQERSHCNLLRTVVFNTFKDI